MTVRDVLADLYTRSRHARRALIMVWQAAPRVTALWLVLVIVQGLVPGALIYLTKAIVDGMATAIGSGMTEGWRAAIGPALGPVLAMGALLLVQQALGSLVLYVQTSHSERIQDVIKEKIHAKATEVDYAFYDSEDYRNKLQDAHMQASMRALALLQNVGTLLQGSVSFGSIALILASYALWLPLALVAGALPGLLVLVQHNRVYRAWWDHTMRQRRRAQYLDIVLIMPDYVAESRIYGFGPTLAANYQSIRRDLREGQLHLLRRQTIARLAASLLTLGGIGTIMAWMVAQALRGAATLGDIALFYQAVNQGQGIVRSFLDGVGSLYTNSLFLEQLFAFLDLESTIEEPAEPVAVPWPVREGITFDNVSFSYPGAERASLTGLSLHVPAGQIAAIVGTNGAGKSTLIKLLCRFYEVDAGAVRIDGHDVRSFARADLLRSINVLFQKPVEHQDTARSNIALADMTASDEAIVAAAEAAGAHSVIERLPRGYDSVLGRMFYEGAELSGGQWQRVALARAYLRPAPIVILDEPTSAMDSWSEMDWFRRFRTLVAGRTAAIVTHRFTVAMQADVIYVMSDGRVVESGTHAQLMALGGRYAASWNEQTRQGEPASMESIGETGTPIPE